MNKVEWNSNTLKEVKKFPEDIRRELGYLIYQLQIGKQLAMPLSRSMPSLGKGCHELRVKDSDGIYRVFYILKVEGKVIIFHAFQKKTQKTSQKDIDLGKKNLKELLNEKE